MRVLIGIDDTDNLDSRGTGFQARSLGISLREAGLFSLRTVTRHQLLADIRIPFTSHNSSACLYGEAPAGVEPLIDHCRDFLIRESAFDSDAGLCVAPEAEITDEIIAFGNRAKHEVVTMEDALRLIGNKSIFLDGFLNARIGLIGALAAVGLRAGGEDGRLLWTRNLRETAGDYTVRQLLDSVDIDRVVDMDRKQVHENARITVDEWCRPVMLGGLITLIAVKTDETNPYVYQSASKDYIKSISE